MAAGFRVFGTQLILSLIFFTGVTHADEADPCEENLLPSSRVSIGQVPWGQFEVMKILKDLDDAGLPTWANAFEKGSEDAAVGKHLQTKVHRHATPSKFSKAVRKRNPGIGWAEIRTKAGIVDPPASSESKGSQFLKPGRSVLVQPDSNRMIWKNIDPALVLKAMEAVQLPTQWIAFTPRQDRTVADWFKSNIHANANPVNFATAAKRHYETGNWNEVLKQAGIEIKEVNVSGGTDNPYLLPGKTALVDEISSRIIWRNVNMLKLIKAIHDEGLPTRWTAFEKGENGSPGITAFLKKSLHEKAERNPFAQALRRSQDGKGWNEVLKAAGIETSALHISDAQLNWKKIDIAGIFKGLEAAGLPLRSTEFLKPANPKIAEWLKIHVHPDCTPPKFRGAVLDRWNITDWTKALERANVSPVDWTTKTDEEFYQIFRSIYQKKY